MPNKAQMLLMLTLLMLGSSRPAEAQARLTIVNQSERELSVKVMRAAGAEDVLHGRLSIGPKQRGTMTFSQTGEYFTKSMATLSGKDPLYQKGQPFKVYVGSDGYSVLTLTITIVESAVPHTDGRPISKDEFDRDVSRR